MWFFVARRCAILAQKLVCLRCNASQRNSLPTARCIVSDTEFFWLQPRLRPGVTHVSSQERVRGIEVSQGHPELLRSADLRFKQRRAVGLRARLPSRGLAAPRAAQALPGCGGAALRGLRVVHLELAPAAAEEREAARPVGEAVCPQLTD